MKRAVRDVSVEKFRPLNAVSLKNAVLCVECDVVSDSPHDQCLVCGSRSLFNISRLFGGMMPKQRAKLVAKGIAPQPVLTFPKPHRVRTRNHALRPEPLPVELQLGLYAKPRS